MKHNTLSKLYKPIVVGAMLLSSTSALSEEYDFKLYFGGWSKHLQDKNQNETHNTVGLNYKNFEVLNFNNSYNNNSTFVGYHYKFNEYFGLRGGVVSGYDNLKYNFHGFVPMIQPTISFEVLTFGIEVGYIPYTDSNHKGAVTLQAYLKF